MVGGAIGQGAHDAVIEDDRAADEPLAVGRPRCPGPAARNDKVVAIDDRLAKWREHAAGDGARIGEDRFGMNVGQPRSGERGGAGDHRAPAGGGIGLAERFERGEDIGGGRFGTAEAARYRHAEQAGVGDLVRKVGGQATLRLGIGGAGGDDGGEIAGGGEDGHSPTRPPARWPSLAVPAGERAVAFTASTGLPGCSSACRCCRRRSACRAGRGHGVPCRRHRTGHRRP